MRLTHPQIQFARANALAGYKSKNLDDIAAVSCHGPPTFWHDLTFSRQHKSSHTFDTKQSSTLLSVESSDSHKKR